MEESQRQRKPFDLFGTIRVYARATVFFGTLLFICLSPLALILYSSTYIAQGNILVDRNQNSLGLSNDQSPFALFYQNYAETEVQRILNAAILRKTLQNLPPRAQKIYAPKGPTPQAVAALRRGLVVGLIPNSHLIMVQFHSATPTGTAEVVNTLMQTYLEHAAQLAENKDARRLAFLQEERDSLQREADSLAAQLSALAAEARTSSFDESHNIDSLRVAELQKVWVAARQNRLLLENQFREQERRAQQVRELPASALIDELTANDELLGATTDWTYKTVQGLRASMEGVSARNPDRRAAEERIQALLRHEAALKKDVTERSRRIVEGKRDYGLDSDGIMAQTAFLAAEKTETALREELAAAQKEAAANAQRIIRGQGVVATLTRVRDRMHAMIARIQEIRAESKSPLRASIEEVAQESTIPSGNNLKKLIILLGTLSFGVVGCAFLVVEVTDDRIRSEEDITYATGHQPPRPIELWRGEAPFHRITHEAPDAPPARALRSLAMRLDRERRHNGAKTALLAAVDESSGTTGIAVNVARSITALGVKTVLVEADKDNAPLSRVLGVDSSKPGAPISPLVPARVHALKDESFDLLVMEERVSEQENHYFNQAVSALRERYEFVLIDAAPLLPSDLTESLLLGADVVCLVVQGDRTTCPAMRHALDLLEDMRVRAVAVVLNWGAPRTRNAAERLLSRLPAPLPRMLMPRLLEGDYTDTPPVIPIPPLATNLWRRAEELGRSLRLPEKWRRKTAPSAKAEASADDTPPENRRDA